MPQGERKLGEMDESFVREFRSDDFEGLATIYVQFARVTKELASGVCV